MKESKGMLTKLMTKESSSILAWVMKVTFMGEWENSLKACG